MLQKIECLKELHGVSEKPYKFDLTSICSCFTAALDVSCSAKCYMASDLKSL